MAFTSQGSYFVESVHTCSCGGVAEGVRTAPSGFCSTTAVLRNPSPSIRMTGAWGLSHVEHTTPPPVTSRLTPRSQMIVPSSSTMTYLNTERTAGERMTHASGRVIQSGNVLGVVSQISAQLGSHPPSSSLSPTTATYWPGRVNGHDTTNTRETPCLVADILVRSGITFASSKTRRLSEHRHIRGRVCHGSFDTFLCAYRGVGYPRTVTRQRDMLPLTYPV